MAKNTCDGEVYIRNLSSFIKSHERQLANALVAYKKLNSKDQAKAASNPYDSSHNIKATHDSLSSSRDTDSKSNEKNINNSDSTSKMHADNSDTVSNSDKTKTRNHISVEGIVDSKLDEEDNLTKEISKPVRLSLSLHHLYFILGKFQELGIAVGPMNLRLDNMDSENNTNYVSFLSEFQRNKKIDSDSQSIHSISSVKSVMSSVSALWNTFSSSSKNDNTMSDLKYLYSAFSKLPCLRLANEPNAKLIEGHEEYPFETATPIVIFKNLLVLEISDLDPKEIYGWNILANKLRYLVIKKANLLDPFEILVTLVEADSNVRREDDDYIENDDTFNFRTDNNQPLLKGDNEHYDEFFVDDNKLTKTTSNGSELNEPYEKLSHRNSAISSSIPLSHSSLSLVSSLSTSKNHTSPTLHQPQNFPSSQHALNSYHLPPHASVNPHANPYSYNHNHNHGHYHHYHHNPLSSESLASFSTSPTATSYSSNYHPSRLYAEDILMANSQQSTLSSSVHSSRRSYYYKPQKKSRRSRGSSSMIINSNNGMTPIANTLSQSLTNNSLKSIGDTGSTELQTKADPSSKSEELNTSVKKGNTKNGADDVKNSSESQVSDKLSKSWRLLKHLSFTDNKIEKISLNSFDHLSNLTLLDLSYNNLTTIPSEPFSKLVNLKTLNLSFNKLLTLKKFPKSLTKLTVLNLRGNKISDLDSIENLSLLQKIDLRQNKLHKVSNLKPLLLLNKDKVLLSSVQLLGNPIAKSRGYRVELFNLFNGVDYSNNVRIDGSKPGIFESRMLLDEKTSKMRFKNYMDESIISKMTASVSNMNLSNIINHSTKSQIPFSNSKGIASNAPHSMALRENSFNSNSDHKKSDSHETNTPVLDQMTTSITVQPDGNNRSFNRTSMSSTKNPSGVLKNHEKDQIGSMLRNSTVIDAEDASTQPIPDNATTLSAGSFAPPNIAPSEGYQISPSPSMLSIRNPVTVSFLNSNTNTNSNSNDLASMAMNNSNGLSDFNAPISRSVPHSQRASNDFSSTSSIVTSSTTTANVDNNPIARLSLASPALPVITQATTTTMTITSVSNPVEPRNPNNESLRSDYFGISKGKDNDENKENESTHAVNDDSKLSGEEFSSGLKISVI